MPCFYSEYANLLHPLLGKYSASVDKLGRLLLQTFYSYQMLMPVEERLMNGNLCPFGSRNLISVYGRIAHQKPLPRVFRLLHKLQVSCMLNSSPETTSKGVQAPAQASGVLLLLHKVQGNVAMKVPQGLRKGLHPV
ncbi:unnamed protein product [Sphagnum balticum]